MVEQELFHGAFDSDEKSLIIGSVVSTDIAPDYNTAPVGDAKDCVFLLSTIEANEYFAADNLRLCSGTIYCNNSGSYKDLQGNCQWWLRSPGEGGVSEAIVSYDGHVNTAGINVMSNHVSVRPAIWVNLGLD